MFHPDCRTNRPIFAVLAIVFVSFLTVPPEAKCQDKGAPPWGEWLRKFKRDRLLKKPFHNSPEEEVKGLASKLRARELDIPNRVKAIQYLATFHCAKFPEARDMLLDVLHNDKWEPVRYEAAVALRDMFENCACDCEADEREKRSGRRRNGQEEEEEEEVNEEDRRRGAPDPGSPRHCACCCDAKTLESIAKVAYEIKEDGCTYEPSRRVRQMAVEAIAACGVPCCYQPYIGHEQGPPAWETDDGGGSNNGGEVVPPPSNELTPVPDTTGRELSIPSVTTVRPTPIPGLSKVCLVSLKQGQRVTPSQRFSATYRGRVYHFASQAALEEFKRAPQDYAVAFGGCDPVHFVETKEVLEGRFLVMHDNRFYMFATRQNYASFRADTARYTGKNTNASQLALAGSKP